MTPSPGYQHCAPYATSAWALLHRRRGFLVGRESVTLLTGFV
jgi:hypothetical protein